MREKVGVTKVGGRTLPSGRGYAASDARLLLTLAIASAPRSLQPHGTESMRAP